MCSGQVHRQRGIALLEQACVGHEVGAADDRDGAAGVGVSDHRALVALRHRHVARCFEGVAGAELHVARRARPPADRNPEGRPACPPRIAAPAAQGSLWSAISARRIKTVAGHRSQPPQYVVVDEVSASAPSAPTNRASPRARRLRCRRRPSTSTPWSRSSATRAWAPVGRRCGGIHSAAGSGRRQQRADRGDDADDDDRQHHPAAGPPALRDRRLDRRCRVRHRTDVQSSGRRRSRGRDGPGRAT